MHQSLHVRLRVALLFPKCSCHGGSAKHIARPANVHLKTLAVMAGAAMNLRWGPRETVPAKDYGSPAFASPSMMR
jgi:hypothetical protein